MKWTLAIIFLISVLVVMRFTLNKPVIAPHRIEAEVQDTQVDGNETAEPTATPSPSPTATPVAESIKDIEVKPSQSPVIAVSMNVNGQKLLIPASQEKRPATTPTREFIVDEGIAVIDGDIAIGNVRHAGQTGTANLAPPLNWNTSEIPYFIEPGLEHPERVRQAIKYFSSTALRFVEVTNQKDVLIFQTALGVCKSYVGRIGGKQPIWIAPACGPREIAHEIMHALGFIHEQNRSDRDGSIRIFTQNIDPFKIRNFQTMPSTFMTLSGLTDFTFDSIMLYPPTMFSANGQPTMESITSGKRIRPSETKLSDNDIARINGFFRAR